MIPHFLLEMVRQSGQLLLLKAAVNLPPSQGVRMIFT